MLLVAALNSGSNMLSGAPLKISIGPPHLDNVGLVPNLLLYENLQQEWNYIGLLRDLLELHEQGPLNTSKVLNKSERLIHIRQQHGRYL